MRGSHRSFFRTRNADSRMRHDGDGAQPTRSVEVFLLHFPRLAGLMVHDRLILRVADSQRYNASSAWISRVQCENWHSETSLLSGGPHSPACN